MAKPDYSTWLTKQQAAEAIGVSTKTIEKMADAGELQQAVWKRPTGGPAIAVYHPSDVGRIRQQRNPKAEPFILPEEPQSKALSPISESSQKGAEGLFKALAAAAAMISEKSQNGYRSAVYLTLDQATQFTGLGASHLRRLVEEGKLKKLKGAGPRGADVFRRRDLEEL